jgi:hypothetical protein
MQYWTMLDVDCPLSLELQPGLSGINDAGQALEAIGANARIPNLHL